ncbi:tetratricopeptide repeat protein [Streptomyces tagetis]|uniref:Tetratricopeptide repeat protein n=1 Tax=Streptomyces tagetis TaxID=2820809 RepID=A0A940XIH5_9ACTN|nr:tetratricopeptide repeat protein [Streptomyces sp. RG38]MBQ0829024.1 tetratricopeptide repeat protein [Streptomyces sp. RG38]
MDHDTSSAPDRRPRRRAGRARRVLIVCVAGGAVLGGALVLPGRGRDGAPPPAPGPAAAARGAFAAGAPAALSDLAVLIGDREARVRERPRDGPAWAVLGAAYVERGRRTADPADWPRAEKALRTALETGAARDPGALESLAALAVARRDFAEARTWGERAAGRAPKRWTAQAVLIEAYTGLGDHEAAGKALERMVELGPKLPAVRARAAAVYRDRGWREDAEAQIGDAAAAAGTPAERAAYLEQAGRLAFERGDREKALRYAREALREGPDQAAARAGEARALAALGRTEEAVSAYRAAYAARPGAEYARELGELFASLGREPEAEEQWALVRERVRQAEAAGADGSLVLGLAEADHGDAEAAVERLRAEWGRQPSTEVADALGWALHRAGQDEEALAFAVAATDGERGGGVRSALFAFHRGVVERGLGLTGAARRHLEEALRVNPYFSPLHAPAARRALDELGGPPVGDPPPA